MNRVDENIVSMKFCISYWLYVAASPESLLEKEMSQEEALCLVKYHEAALSNYLKDLEPNQKRKLS